MTHLDSRIVIGCLRGDQKLRDRIAAMPFRAGISAIALAEVSFGARNARDVPRHVQSLAEFVALVAVADFDARCAEVYAKMRVALRKKNKQSSDMDMLIAATALAHNASLATLNVKHFEHVDDLPVEDWT